MNKEEFVSLYEKYLADNCTAEEIKRLESFQDDFNLDEIYQDQTETTDRIHQKLSESIEKSSTKKLQWYKLPLAAAVAILTVSALLYFSLQNTQDPVTKSQSARAVIVPGGNKATLTLDDGSEIVLDSNANGIVARQGAATIKKVEGGKIMYEAVLTDEALANKFNTIKIPRGGQYQLILPDGTKVWLNAASSLRFPVAFSKKDRRVELIGEAYFEVAKNKNKAFHVLANGTEIKVLGTHFNVNSYTPEVNTTLLEGSVQLLSGKNKLTLKPGQFGIKQPAGNFKSGKADLEAIVGWKNGYFIFHDESISSIMQQVSRWYDVDIEIKGNVEHKEFYAKLSRYKDISELLKNMELTGLVNFKIIPGDASGKGRRIIVMP